MKNTKSTCLKGDFTALVEITVEDADFICSLRNDEKNNKYLSSQALVDFDQQRSWILENKDKNDNFYFKILDINSNKSVGTIALYNIQDNEAEFGRYICLSPLQAIEAEFLLLKFGFETLALHRIYCRTMIENKKIWSQHYNLGFKEVSECGLIRDDVHFMTQEILSESYKAFDYTKLKKILRAFKKR